MDDPNENPLILDDDPPIIELLQGSSLSNFYFFFQPTNLKVLSFWLNDQDIEHSLKCS